MDARDATLQLIAPHGGTLRNLYLPSAEADAEREKALELTSYDLTPRQLCDIELLLNGAFSPLEGFLGKADYDSVVASMRLTDGTLWPMPVTLDVSEAFADSISEGDDLAPAELREPLPQLRRTIT
jgi:sulfate adenylyltransferase